MQISEARYRFRGELLLSELRSTYRSRGELYVCSMQYQFPQSPRRLLFGNAFENWWRCKAAAELKPPQPPPAPPPSARELLLLWLMTRRPRHAYELDGLEMGAWVTVLRENFGSERIILKDFKIFLLEFLI